jgi:hypothetical protein
LSIINKHFRGWKSVIWQLRFSKNFKKFIHKRRAIKPAGLFLITLQKKRGLFIHRKHRIKQQFEDKLTPEERGKRRNHTIFENNQDEVEIDITHLGL